MLRYPVLMVHGMGFRDNRIFNYWGRIPRSLEELGCRIYYGGQDSNGDIESNALVIARRIDEILKETGAEKVNIIAHSKGGLDSRYAISTLGMGDRVASLTTMSTPHNGSVTLDKLLRFPAFLVRAGCFFTDCWYRILGDRHPATYKVIHSFTTARAREFNLSNPDDGRVFYQSYAFVMKNPGSDFFMWLTCLAVKLMEGENDGLLTPESARWTNFRGIFRGAGRRGISHCDEVDMRRRPLCKRKSEGGVSDIVDVYREAASELARLGL